MNTFLCGDDKRLIGDGDAHLYTDNVALLSPLQWDMIFLDGGDLLRVRPFTAFERHDISQGDGHIQIQNRDTDAIVVMHDLADDLDLQLRHAFCSSFFCCVCLFRCTLERALCTGREGSNRHKKKGKGNSPCYSGHTLMANSSNIQKRLLLAGTWLKKFLWKKGNEGESLIEGVHGAVVVLPFDFFEIHPEIFHADAVVSMEALLRP